MTDGVFRIETVVDAGSGVDVGVNKTKAKLAEIGDAGEEAGRKASEGIGKIGSQGSGAAEVLDRSTKGIIASIQRTTAAMEAGSRGTSQYYEAIANQRGANVDALKPYLVQLDEAIAKQKLAQGSLQNMGITAGQTAQALRSVPAQFTDIVVSLQGGQKPLTVLLQQGGQLKDMFGGVGAAAKALGGYVLGLVNPYTIAAAAVGGLAYAYISGAAEANEMAKNIILSGNAAGTSVNNLKNLSQSVAAATGATKGAAVDALDQMVKSGKVAESALGGAATAAVAMNRATGKAISDTVTEFESLGKSPVEASAKLNEQYNYLTATVYKQIKALEDQGKTAEAAALAQKTFADAQIETAAKVTASMGTLEKAWQGVGDVAKNAWDKMLNVGREGSLEQQLAAARQALANGGSLFGGATNDRAQIAVIEAQIEAEKKKNIALAEGNALAKAGIEWEKGGTAYLTKEQQMRQEINKAREQGNAAGVKQVDIESRIAAIREKYTDKKSGKSQEVKDAEELNSLLDKISGKKTGLDANYWSDLETLHKAYQKGKLTLDQYATAVGNLTKEQKFAKDADKATLDGVKERSDLMAKMVDEEVKRLTGLQKSNDALRDEIAMLGMSKDQQALYKAAKNDVAAADDLATAAAIENNLEEMRINGVMPDIIAGYEQLAAAKRASAEQLSVQAELDRQKAGKEVAVKAAEDSSKAWQKFGDEINRSLTDSLFRAFESGESFGHAFAQSLKNTFKSMVLKLAINYTVDSAGSLISDGINAIAGTSSANGGNGVNYLGLASNANSAYNLYGAASQYLTGSAVGASGYSLAYANGVGALGGDSIGALYTANGGWAGVSVAGEGTAAGTGAAGTGTAASGTGASLGVSSIAWVAAIVAGMYMSSEAWRKGVRWENYAAQGDTKSWDAEVAIRAMKDEPMRAIFGDKFVNSQLYAILGGGSLSAQIHYAIQSALFGAKRVTGYQTTGTFSEDTQGFSGQYGVNMKKSGGLFSSSREWTDWYALPADFTSIMGTLYKGVRNSFIMLGEVFDDTSLADKLKGFSYSFSVATNDLSAAADVASNGLMQAMGNVLIPSVSQLAKSGESWTASFERILNETNAVGRAFELMGKTIVGTFGKNNLDGILRGSDALVGFFGTIDAFNTAFAGYYSNFYTQADQTKQLWADMKVQFDNIGQIMPTTRQGFKDLVNSLDLSTTAGQGTFAALMSLQAGFAALTPTLDDVAASAAAIVSANREAQAQQIAKYLEAQRTAQQDIIKGNITAAQTAADAAQSMADTFTSILASMKDYKNSLLLGDTSTLSPEAKYAAAKKTYDDIASKAKLGDSTAAGQLQGASNDFLKASMATGSAKTYSLDLGRVLANVDSVMSVADRQIPIAESQLKVAQDQLTALNAMLDKMSGNQTPIVVGNYQQAATDWASFFTTTSIGDVVQTAAGAMQRISDSMGIFIDKAGTGFTFSSQDNPYTLAGSSDAYRQYLLAKYGTYTVPTFASGGYHAGGLRLVGENGPEMEITGQSNIVNAGDTRSMMDNWSGMLDELKALRSEVALLRDEQKAGNATIASNTSRSARLVEKFDIDGLPAVRAA